MDNATENTAANRAVFREGGTLDPNVTAAAPLGGAANAAMDGRASGPGAVRNGHRERAPDARVGRVAPRIPKLREGACLPGAIAEAWARGGRGHRGDRHREPRVPARPSVVAAPPRSGRRAAGGLRRPRGPGARGGRGVPGLVLAAPHRPPGAQRGRPVPPQARRRGGGRRGRRARGRRAVRAHPPRLPARARQMDADQRRPGGG